jgi:hypothetical protein
VVALRVQPRRPLLAVALLMFLWWPLAALLAARAPLAAIAAASFCASLGLAWANALWSTTLQQQIPRGSISRVSSFDWLGTLVLNPVGFALVGPLAAWVGVTTTLAAAATVVAAATVMVLCVPGVRHLGRPEIMADRSPLPEGTA